MDKKAILLGASGLIGGSLLKQLLECPDYSGVLVLVRKKLDVEHPKLKQLVLDFDNLSAHASEIKGDVVFCCLGTTKSKTPDAAQYRKIDYQYPLDVAAIAQANGAEHYHLVSSMGANADSSIFYTRTKGEAERDLKAIPFKSIYIYRPSLLDGERKESRFAEKVMISVMRFINPILTGKLKKYRSIKIEKVAAAMLKESLTNKEGVFIHLSDQIEALT
ncbi:oxidoreductase [Pedobacter metabolipauper]|uniref:Putative NAD(P)-binding protein n=1 Tax=Pedobacter metabolipauper TaxID=425513 RepID=A0A4R6SZ75_9SPHI|nr:oxidoreductase [Pedobacter metabolipauper]TDQ09835.1 putative NAD(P)-binding protein [Pedobacter metabolipauper]